MRDDHQARPGSLLDSLGSEAWIAVVRPGRIGDLVVATPALRTLRSTMPKAHISLITDFEGRSMAEHLNWIDEVIVAPIRLIPWGDPIDPAELDRFFAEVRARSFDLAIQLKGAGNSTNAFVRSRGARFTAGQRELDTPPLDVWMPYQLLQPEAQRLLNIMEMIGAPRGLPWTEIEVRPEYIAELRSVRDLDHAALQHRDVIGVHVGSKALARRWPVERFVSVLESLLDETTFRFVLIGTADEAEINTAILNRVGQSDRVADLAGRLSVGSLIALLSELRVLIGNDSGPAHLATALNTPAVVIFGNAQPAMWAPAFRAWQRTVFVARALCRIVREACGCPDGELSHCLNMVGVDDVLNEIRSLLALLEATEPGSVKRSSHWSEAERSEAGINRGHGDD